MSAITTTNSSCCSLPRLQFWSGLFICKQRTIELKRKRNTGRFPLSLYLPGGQESLLTECATDSQGNVGNLFSDLMQKSRNAESFAALSSVWQLTLLLWNSSSHNIMTRNLLLLHTFYTEYIIMFCNLLETTLKIIQKVKARKLIKSRNYFQFIFQSL